ncbi:MAG TPA: ATP-dependent DNA helicase UvrD2 [Candidatus Dormibacteraeota bacterium]|nr:ATP-dependent DNA helicase UvrD2 [Candidatus Dormibacteraeota bacterium]
MGDERDPKRLLDDLNEAQREAVSATRGPVVIIAGAGSGKTRVISHRAAYAIETGAVRADRILLVTFTDKAATEMVERVAALGHPRVMAKTFHAAALTQLRHFWPSRHGGEPLPRVSDGKARILFPLASRLPGGYRFTQVKDLAETIEWAKVRRITPERWLADGGDRAPIPAELFARIYADYERAKARAGEIDFEDMLVETVRLLETDADAAALVRERKTWFSVDEYQDTNPLAERLLELWLGESRDLAVVGDPDQTIYSFTGASPEFLLSFERRHPGARVVVLAQNYRSTPQILALANRLLATRARGALEATRPPGVTPSIRRFTDDAAERATIVGAIQALIGEGTAADEIAILVRINAQLPELEQALTRARIPFRLRGQRFFDRREVKEARRLMGTRWHGSEATGGALVGAIRALFEERLGLGAGGDDAGRGDGAGRGDEARERQASLELVLRIVEDVAAAAGGATVADVLLELERRDADEAAGVGSGVNLLTYHRAKGLEWDAVFLPALEEGFLPIRQAKEPVEIDEERRLLYVGITRARRRLALSWAARRAGQGGREGSRKPSRFLAMLEARDGLATRDRRPGQALGSGRIVALEPASADGGSGGPGSVDAHLLEALQLWRRDRARADAVPAYVVAHDSMLQSIAEARPASATALARVKGIGPAKLERYADEILAVVARLR